MPELPSERMEEVRRLAEERIRTIVNRRGGQEGQDLTRLMHELGVYQVELEMQNEELRHAHGALEISRDRYLDLYERAPVGYVTLDLLGFIIEANHAASALLGVPYPRMLGDRFVEYVVPADRHRLEQHLIATAHQQDRGALDLRLVCANAREKAVTLEMALVAEPAHRTAHCRVAMLDISDRVRMHEELSRLAAIVESSEDAIISRDLEGRIDSWNDGARRLFGREADEMVGRTMEELVPEEFKAHEAGLLFRLQQGETVAHVETERLGRGGVRVPVSMSLSPIRDERDEVVGSALIARDISDRRRADRALRERVRQLDVLAHASQALILGEQDPAAMRRDLFERVRAATGSEICLNYGAGIDEESDLVLLSAWGLNEAQQAELAVVPVEDSLAGLVAQRRAGLVVEELQASELPQARRLRAMGVRAFAGYPLLAHDRFYGVAAFASTSRERFRRGDLLVINTLCDQVAAMLERMRLTAELRQSEQTLRRADKAKDDLIATLAHELRNPLAPIRNAVTILRRDNADAKQIAWCRDVIERQVVQMTHLLEDLLDASRLTRNKIELRVERFPLQRPIEQAVEATQHLLDARHHRLKLQLPEETVMVHGDLTRLTQVFANLLNNAAKYSDPGSEILLGAELDGEQVRISVRDHGIGISAEQLPLIFRMFSQLAPALDRSGGGLGIGLALARGLVEQHGGSLQARSEGAGKGSEFVVTLPVGTAPPRVHGGSSQAAVSDPPQHRLLVVDDNVDAAQTLAAMLTLHGQDVRTAFNGYDALQVAETWRPDVAVLDIGMPGLNGYQLCERLREQSHGRPPLLIACTGWGQEADRERAHAAGFDFHLVKPIEPAALLRLLAAAEADPARG
ncbi:PAS domain S-box protein [Ideonella sp. YS5]|uniref:PAS domain-containing hybrid sensor histidine kinase/response regulator n=1 Tax=Ideonella sp. YS5 TaxID=3453714 RepID=UPI003EEF4EE0